MPFELFHPDFRNQRLTGKTPLVKLYKSGKIALNRAAYETLGSPVEMHLLFDAERRMVGLKPVKEGSPNAYRINPTNRTVGTSAFFKVYNIPLNLNRPLRAEMEGDMLVFSVKERQPLVMENPK